MLSSSVTLKSFVLRPASFLSPVQKFYVPSLSHVILCFEPLRCASKGCRTVFLFILLASNEP